MTVDLIFDTETTGLPNYKAPFNHPTQPDVLQLGLQLYTDKKLTFEKKFLVGLHTRIGMDFEVEPGAQSVHGISREMIIADGVHVDEVRDTFLECVSKADRLVAHNLSFDMKMMSTFLFRLDAPYNFIDGKQLICTMNSTTNLCKLPGNYGYKWPKLIEAYKLLVNPKGFEGAHDALVDVKACAEILYQLEKYNKPLKGPSK